MISINRSASKDALKVYQLAAWRMDIGQHVISNGKTVDFDQLRSRLDELTEMALEDPSCGGNPIAMTRENTRALFGACM